MGCTTALKFFIFTFLFFSLRGYAKNETPEFVSGEYVVQLKTGVSQKQLAKALSSPLNFKIKSWWPQFKLAVLKSNSPLDPKGILSSFVGHPLIRKIEPNYIYRIHRRPNDPDLSQLWGLVNEGQADSKNAMGLPGMDIGAEQAWDLQTGNQDLVVAVIDTGINYQHPSLNENIWTNEAELNGQAGVDDDGNGYIDDVHGYDFVNKDGDPMDDHGHGTHCSGTIGARGDDGVSIAGVVWKTKLMGIKFLSKSGSGNLEDAVLGIKYAMAMGAKVMSNSWGGGGYSEILKDAIQEAGDRGIIFTAAAGNNSSNNDQTPSYPASYNLPNVISVAAVDNRGHLAKFSNFGRRTVHVAAPGVNIYSSIVNGYDSWSGTSMATPHVSEVVALLLAEEPLLTPIEVRQRLVTTSKPLANLKSQVAAGGMVNAFYALTKQVAPPDMNDPENWTSFREETIATSHPYGKSLELTWEIQEQGASQIAVYFSQFNTELKYDKVSFYSKEGQLLGVMTGDLGPTWSPAFAGDYVKIVFTTDKSVNKYGFDLTRVAYR